MIRNLIFDLGGVVLGRNFDRFAAMLGDTFSFISGNDFPLYWSEFDRGIYSRQQVATMLADDKHCTVAQADEAIEKLLLLLQEIPETKELLGELKRKGYKLYVLSNMSREFYEHISQFEVFSLFDGCVVSCYEHLNKPDERLYRTILERYSLVPSETLFSDDKQINTAAAERLGIKTVTFTSVGEGIKQINAILNGSNR